MTGVTIVAQVSGLEAVARRIGRLGSLDRARLLDGLGQLGETQTKKRFKTKQSPNGGAWIARRPALDGGSDSSNELMVKSGHLRDSIHHVVEGSHAVRWGSGLVYAAIHQTGGTIVPKAKKALVWKGADGRLIFAQKVRIPARPYLGVGRDDARQMERLALSFIGSQLGGAT